jgi:uncharacterized protein YchJ
MSQCNEIEVNGMKYNYKGKEARVIGFGKTDKKLSFPICIDVAKKKYSVKEISGFAEWNGTTVFIPDKVKKLGDKCFESCGSLRHVILG